MDEAEADIGRMEQLLAELPDNGDPVGNPALRDRLGWERADFWRVRDKLIDSGLILRGRGRGGSARKVVAPIPAATADGTDLAGAEAPRIRVTEAELYAPIREIIATDWADDRGARPIAVLDIAAQGRRATGGKWTRPDVVFVDIRTFLYLPGKFIDVITFEVKPSDCVNVTAVYEALAHRRRSTHSYVVFHVPPSAEEDLRETLAEVVGVARTHGIGVITVGDVRDYETWDEVAEAARVDPDPELLNEFIGVQLSAAREDIALQVR